MAVLQFSGEREAISYDGIDGGDSGGGNMEARIARLESDMSHVKSDISEIKADFREFRKDARTDFRLTFGALIAVALGLAGLMAKGFGWIG
ncbi:hypothetical protein [Desulfovibrio sp.]|uniref:hypothetical protein n=1 Tax=Desulfovibrio sp. TaxID=885 RepID=UPI0025C635A4|nr:hypothetical protein [Desulfovibrio sp.]